MIHATKKRGSMVLAAVLVMTSAVHAGSGPSFQNLGVLPGGSSSLAMGISSDGLVVVGTSSSSNGNNEAFRWTAAGGMVGLGDLPGGDFRGQANKASSNGSVIVGRSSSSVSAPGWSEAFRWTSAGGMVGLGGLPGQPLRNSEALDVSGVGSVVVGTVQNTQFTPVRAFRWTTAGMVDLGSFTGSSGTSRAWGVSANGVIVVGSSTSTLEPFFAEAFRWTSAGGMATLSGYPAGYVPTDARAISSDGSTIVGDGFSTTTFQREAFRWTEGEGVVRLGDLPGGEVLSFGWGVSANGAVVVGESWTGLGREAFVWTQASGMRNLKEVLVGYGLNLDGWTLRAAQGVSGDGRTIVGWGSSPDGPTRAWLARLCPDADGDGVCDANDDCLGTPDGEPVNEFGCSCSQLPDLNCDDDGNPCTTNECVAGECVQSPVDGGTECVDGDPCTAESECQNGECVGTVDVDCSHLDDDCNVGVCNAFGDCVAESANDGGDCDDDDPCTENDACSGGACGGAPVASPVIVAQPSRRGVLAGGQASFTVETADDPAGLSYQWRKDGVDLVNDGRIVGADSDALTIDPVDTADAGFYDVVISNDCGDTVSAAARLTVLLPAPPIQPLPSTSQSRPGVKTQQHKQSEDDQALCAVGAAPMLPLTLTGLLVMKRRRQR
jgi:probable HAF family extracellular repeat protein